MGHCPCQIMDCGEEYVDVYHFHPEDPRHLTSLGTESVEALILSRWP